MTEPPHRSGQDHDGLLHRPAITPGMTETGPLERLRERFNTVGALWDDATDSWVVVADPQRSTFDDCRWSGTGDTLDEAAEALIARLPE